MSSFCKLGHPAKEYSHEAIGLVTGRKLAPVTTMIGFAPAVERLRFSSKYPLLLDSILVPTLERSAQSDALNHSATAAYYKHILYNVHKL